MPIARFQPNLDRARRVLASGLIDAVLGACDPGIALAKHLDPSVFTRPTHILSFGKASIPMTNAAIEILGERFARATVLSTPALCAKTDFKSKFVELLGATHPLPTQQNIDATNALVAHARSIPVDHQALVLISGGASAMLCSPKPGVSLDHIISATDTLIRSGASIEALNAQRAQLETLKAGGLARIIAHIARADGFVLSDVIGDNLRTIGSGPLLDQLPPTIPQTIIANNSTAVDALCAWIAHERINLASVKHQAIGPASEQGRGLARSLLGASVPLPGAVCLGGEPTVDTQGCRGIGGPMLELALACAGGLLDAPFRWAIITLTTDGIDGPSDAAGAIITSEMLNVPGAVESIDQSLAEHNTLPLCDALGATIRTGPTATNVNDLGVAIRFDN